MPVARGEPGPVTKNAAMLLRIRLAELQWTQQELASRSGVSQSHLSQILKGNRHIYLDQLDRMCEVMELDLGDIVGAAKALPAREALMDQLDDQVPPVSWTPRAVRTVESGPDAG